MSLAPGATIGQYTIVSALGAGGMGEVYRATDTRLGREVAIKVLPEAVAADPDRLSRFEREARALAALNHFNIAQVYGFEGRALVMELLDGVTLRERLTQGPLPIRKALDIATQIARGLAAAHDRGIIHRDLKPENIFVLPDGHVKIIDFGLARRDDAGEAGATRAVEPMTTPGMVMGTVGYMSPEQVRGLTVDARTDLFSLGTILYEMLTGANTFRRESSADTMAAILNDHPRELSGQRQDASPSLDRLVQHCLEKNPVERFQSARDVAFALESLSGSTLAFSGPTPAVSSWPRERLSWAAITALLLVALAWLTLSNRATTAPPAAPLSRTLLLLPDGVGFNEIATPGSRLAITRDGSRVIIEGRHEASGQRQFFALPVDGGAATPIAGTESGAAPFWSPDGRQILFNLNSTLMRLPLDGGGLVPVASNVGPAMAGSWGPEGTALVGGPALRQIQLQDGAVSTVLASTGSDRFGLPQFLEDGWYVAMRGAAGSDMAVVMGQVGSADVHVLLSGPDLGKAMYATGALLFTRTEALFAQRAEGRPLRLVGDPILIASDVETAPVRGSAFSVSDNGVLVYQAAARDPVRLTWFDRAGRVLSTVGDDGDQTNVELSPDGRRALVSGIDRRLQTRDLFIVDLERGVRQRFTIDPSDERSAIWSPDGRRVVYTSKKLDFYTLAADGSGAEQPLIVDGVSKDPYDVSADGRQLLYRRTGSDTGNDIWIGPTDGSGPGHVVLGTRFSETPGTFSPDGRFFVFSSDESGQREAYVARVDGSGKTQVSIRGGVYPVWRADGSEILYLALDQTLMSAAVQITGDDVSVALPRPLFKLPVGATLGRPYDVTADGRVLAAIPVPSRIPPSITVVTNWPRVLEQE